MESEKIRSASMTQHQKVLLLEFLKNQEQLQSGRFTNTFTHKKAQQLWEEIATILNAVPGGAEKDWKQWRRVWADQKKTVKHKASSHKKLANKTGGGEPPQELTPTENDILSLISPNLISGFTDVSETEITFDFNEEPSTSGTRNNGSEETVKTDEIFIELTGSEATKENEHSYCMDNYNNSTKTSRKRLPTSAKHETALKLNQKLIKIFESKSNILEEYYQEKINYMREKLEILNKNQKIFLDILQRLKNLEKVFVKDTCG